MSTPYDPYMHIFTLIQKAFKRVAEETSDGEVVSQQKIAQALTMEIVEYYGPVNLALIHYRTRDDAEHDINLWSNPHTRQCALIVCGFPHYIPMDSLPAFIGAMQEALAQAAMVEKQSEPVTEH